MADAARGSPTSEIDSVTKDQIRFNKTGEKRTFDDTEIEFFETEGRITTFFNKNKINVIFIIGGKIKIVRNGGIIIVGPRRIPFRVICNFVENSGTVASVNLIKSESPVRCFLRAIGK
ncbi:MAG: hypothetical protein K9L85_03010 [Candidatus Peribacteraceae bacterium]|nr:hypothetical protein [Candidatus Peribacteraceae bacterium]